MLMRAAAWPLRFVVVRLLACCCREVWRGLLYVLRRAALVAVVLLLQRLWRGLLRWQQLCGVALWGRLSCRITFVLLTLQLAWLVCRVPAALACMGVCGVLGGRVCLWQLLAEVCVVCLLLLLAGVDDKTGAV